ncbi:hypothetical protein DIPPA_34023 [Diplonema papillatum]|nr:hypothetical protein DIPPA_34023 [Diplonema papillatum]
MSTLSRNAMAHAKNCLTDSPANAAMEPGRTRVMTQASSTSRPKVAEGGTGGAGTWSVPF